MHIVIVANGDSVPCDLSGASLVIAVNGGTRHTLAWGRTPDIVIGDFDSLDADSRQKLEQAGARLIAHPARKDETDLELALHHAAGLSPRRVTILAAWGDRPDHTLANVLLLLRPEFAGLDVCLIANGQEIRLVRDAITLHGHPGDLVSLLPIECDAVGVSTAGLEYPLHDETLRLGSSRGVSNVMTAGRAGVRLRRGRLLCLHDNPQIRV
ncbi:MAG: thiamine diphosphokinase [Chloroflexi bacterium]|nr:thiamine diphosphokinase [Chloroflexota bacterium]